MKMSASKVHIHCVCRGICTQQMWHRAMLPRSAHFQVRFLIGVSSLKKDVDVQLIMWLTLPIFDVVMMLQMTAGLKDWLEMPGVVRVAADIHCCRGRVWCWWTPGLIASGRMPRLWPLAGLGVDVWFAIVWWKIWSPLSHYIKEPLT